MPYILRNPDEYPDGLDGEYDEDLSPDYLQLTSAEPWSQTNGIPLVRFSGPASLLQEFEFLPNSTRVPLVSQVVYEILKRFCAVDLEGVPATVIAKDRIVHGYCFLNALARIQAIDLERSDYAVFKGSIHPRKFNRLILKRNALGDHHFGRDLNYESYLFVSDDVKVLFANAGWKGYRLIAPEGIQP